MNKRLNRIKSLSCGREVIKGIMLLMTVALFVSCAKGFDGEETFASNVHDSQLASPELSKSCFSSVVNADGTESIRVTWDVVPGAGGYYCHVDNVDDPANPVVVYDGTVDGVSFLFDKADDTKYSVSVKTLGNEKLNNTAAPDPTVYAYSTMVEAQVIPVGTDIADFINSHLIDTEDEQAFELQANGNYTLNSEGITTRVVPMVLMTRWLNNLKYRNISNLEVHPRGCASIFLLFFMFSTKIF